jgi:hypothetical protein
MRAPIAAFVALLLVPSPARAQDEPVVEYTGPEEQAGQPEEPACKETYANCLKGGNRRLILGPITSVVASAGLAVSTYYLMDSISDSMRGGLSGPEVAFSTFVAMPALLSAAILASGIATTSIGAGMRIEAMRLVNKGVPLDQVCYPSWRASYEFGRRHAIHGTFFLVSGTEMFMIGLGAYIVSRLHPDPQYSSWGIGAIHAVFGALTMTAGIVLIYKGNKIMRKALLKREQHAMGRIQLALTPSGLALTW